MKLFIYPQYSRNYKGNPYTLNMQDSLSQFFEIDNYSSYLPNCLKLFFAAFTSDIIILNWLERISKYSFGGIQAFLSVLAIFIMHLRKKQIVWVFHNIHPHDGEDWWSKRIQVLLRNKATVILSHSQEAVNYISEFAKCPVYFRAHPVANIKYDLDSEECQNYDFFIWGSILPYKGVDEFISHPMCKKSQVRIRILGKCSDNVLTDRIYSHCSDYVVFENRRADYSEIAAQCQKAKYVLFPYVGDSISSSGALMDTIQMGGVPVGPNRGAFADLSKVGCCICYNKIEEVFDYVNLDNKKVTKEKRFLFLQTNSWESFALWLFDILNKNKQ